MILKPVQKPHPPLWYGVTLPGNAAWPAENNVNIVALGLRDNTSAIIKAYRETRAKHGLDPDGTLMGVSRHIVVADTDEAALAIARRAYPRWRESFRWLFARHGTEPRVIGIYPPTFDELMALNNGIAGSPETVRRFIAAEIAANDCNYFVPQMVFGDMTLKEALRSIELFAKEIMPAFAARPHEQQAQLLYAFSLQLHRHHGGVLGVAQRQRGLDVAHMRRAGELGDEGLEGLEVRRHAFQHEVDLAGQHPALAHQRLLAHEILERLEVGLGLAGEVDHGEHRDLVAEQLLVEQRPVALDEARLLQRPHPAQAGRRRNADPPRQLHIGDAAVVLQLLQDFPVDGVEAAGQWGLQVWPRLRPLLSRRRGRRETLLRGPRPPPLRVWIKGCVSCIARPKP